MDNIKNNISNINNMNYINFNSTTQLYKAKNLLNKLKIKSKIEKTSNSKTNGCGYQLIFFYSDKSYIKNILNKHNINFIK